MAKKDDVLAIVVRLKGLVSEPFSNNNPTFSQSPAVTETTHMAAS